MRKILLWIVLPLTALGLVHPPALQAQGPAALRPAVFALRDARVVPEAGKVLAKATVVVRDGLIEAVGDNVRIPPDALVIDGKGLTVYPGFVDALSHWGFDPVLRRSEMGPPAMEDYASEALATTKTDNRKGITPEFLVATALKLEEEQADTWRRLGFTAHLVAPEGGLITGQSALVSLSATPPREATLRSPVGMHAAFRIMGTGTDYPRVLMGFVAHTRQVLLDAGHYRRLWDHFESAGRAGRRPPLDPALDGLQTVLTGKLPLIVEADSRDEILRVLDFCAEFKMKPIIYGGRDAWKVADRLKAEQVPVIVRLNFSEGGRPRMGRRGGFPPPGAGAPPAGDEEEPSVPARVKADRERQSKEEVHNAAVLREKGVLFAFSTAGQTGDKPADKFKENYRKLISDGGLKPDAALEALTLGAARLLGVQKQLGSITPGKAAHLVVTDGDWHAAQTQVRYVFADGIRFSYDAKPAGSETTAATKPTEKEKAAAAKTPLAKKPGPGQDALDALATELEIDRKPKTHTGGNLLLKNATVLTVTRGELPDTDVLVQNGKIAQVGKNLTPPAGITTIPADGMFVMPGIIDTHCHFAVSGSVNEFSLSVVPEVRIKDVIDSEDVQIYRALAGGVTTARLLHGSANVIGGEDAVIKLKFGQTARDLLVYGAPRGVKFALGENVKRTDGRFPNTRLGVEAVLIRAFTEAQAYQRQGNEYRAAKTQGRDVVEPRRDLRLEALADILKGDLKVHCHCYRADEILMLLRVADRFGFKVQSLQHVLEGYKIAAEIAQHGASCSTFSDWWAYKIEAYDAIPFNAALLNEAGAVVCMKSDSNELMRHLFQEAAKCVKYGGMSDIDALKTITLNPAKQLGLEKRLGSIEVGKDADLVVFNGHPLNSFARPEMTIIEGEIYFQRSPTLLPYAAAQTRPVHDSGKALELPKQGRGLFALRGATVHAVNHPDVTNAVVLIENGKIQSVGPAGKVKVPPQAKVLDVSGLHVYPGMIDAATVLGLTELGSAKETQDFAEGGDFQPDLRAGAGINPDSELIPVTRANGVLTVVTRPTGSMIAGQSALINLAGWVPREMTLRDPLALNVEFPAPFRMFRGDPALPMLGRAVARKQREEKIRRVKELFQQALAYHEGQRAGRPQNTNPRLEALVPYALGQKPVMIQAQRLNEIQEALKLADELKIKIILSGGAEAWKATAELKKRDVPVIVGPTMAVPGETYDPFDAAYAAPARLREAGLRYCIRSAGTENTRNLPYEAAMAASYGLPPDEALKSVTLYPAQILGVADELGSIEPGKRANLVITNGDLLQATTQVKALFIDGQPFDPASKHTRLYERYRERLKEVKEGRAPLGTR